MNEAIIASRPAPAARGRGRLSERQLKAMDGWPVWVKELKAWTLVHITGGTVWLRPGDGSHILAEDVHCYKQPPEAHA